MENIAIIKLQKQPLRTIALGCIAGTALGVVARVWMRWISTDIEFSWSGTIFIIGAFSIFLTAQSVVLVLRQRIHRAKPTAVLRLFGALFTVPVFFGGAGVLMPAVLFGSMAIYRKDLDRKFRYILLIVGLPGFLSIATEIATNFGWTVATFGRILLLATIYGITTLAIFPIISPYRNPNSQPKMRSRFRKIASVFALILFALIFALMTTGLPQSQR